MTVFSFSNQSDACCWPATNDGVMGGISQGQSEITSEGTLRFFGCVSLENNGGFSSIRSREEAKDLSAYNGILIRVRGDGKPVRPYSPDGREDPGRLLPREVRYGSE